MPDVPCEELDTPAEIGVNPTTMAMTARCGCGTVALESGTYNEAVQALDTHRALTRTPEESGQ